MAPNLIATHFILRPLDPGQDALLYGLFQVACDSEQPTLREQHQQGLKRDRHPHVIDDAGVPGRVGQEALLQLGLVEVLLVRIGGAALPEAEEEAFAEGGLRGGGEVGEG